jgi:hypothetical protein
MAVPAIFCGLMEQILHKAGPEGPSQSLLNSDYILMNLM